MIIPLVIDAGDSEHQAKDVSAQRRINLYPERQTYSGATSEWVLICAPGTRRYIQIGPGLIRGMYKAGNGSLYVVKGTTVYEIHDRSGAMTVYPRGALLSDATPVTMADNGTHVAIADGMSLYLHELSGDSDIFTVNTPFTAPTHVVFIGGRLVCNATQGTGEDKNRVWYSDIFNATSWPALNFFSAEAFGDPVVALAVRLGDLCVFGSDSFEIFSLTGNQYNPFSRVGSAMLGIGCSAPYSVVSVSDTVFFVGGSRGGNNTVYALSGYNANVISDQTITHRIVDIRNVIGWTYSERGNVFYVLSIGSDDTWVYDSGTMRWHRRRGMNDDGSPRSWKAIYSEFFDNKTVVGFIGLDWLCVLDRNAMTDADDRHIIRTYRSNNIVLPGFRTWHRVLHVQIDTGRAPVYGLRPQAMMRFSDDGGYTWSRSFWQSFGSRGQYARALRWSMLGTARERIYEIQISDAADFTILGAHVEAEKIG